MDEALKDVDVAGPYTGSPSPRFQVATKRRFNVVW
jgi:hypothetical protein